MKCKYCTTPKAWKLRRGAYKCRSCRREWRAGETVIRGGRLTKTVLLELLKRMARHRTLLNIVDELQLSKPTILKYFSIARTAMARDIPVYFDEDIEVDGAYLGGNRLNHRRWIRMVKSKRGHGTTKTALFGVRGRQSGLLRVWLNTRENREGAIAVIDQFVAKGRTVFSDDYWTYEVLPRLGYPHRVVVHSQQEYVRADAHTNGIEGFWGVMKKRLKVGGWRKEHYEAFLAQEVWFYNNRHLSVDKKAERMLDLIEKLVAST